RPASRKFHPGKEVKTVEQFKRRGMAAPFCFVCNRFSQRIVFLVNAFCSKNRSCAQALGREERIFFLCFYRRLKPAPARLKQLAEKQFFYDVQASVIRRYRPKS